MHKMIKTDQNAHSVLVSVKQEMKECGINSPTFSDAIRWMRKKRGTM